MKVKVICLAQHAYAAITTPNRSLDVLLFPGRSPAQSMRETVEEMREKAAKILDRAAFIESAIEHLEGEKE